MHTLGTAILALVTFASIVGAQSNITHAGIRASKYGIKEMPTPRGYHNAIWAMNSYFPGTIPTMVWTVTEADGEVPEKMFDCRFYFPNDKNYPTDGYVYDSKDLSEPYLSYFDTAGIKVYLQIEPADGDIKTIIDIIFKRYGHHSCIIGFGVDAEWYECSKNEWGKKVTDAIAQEWENVVKSNQTPNQNLTFFIKHPDKKNTHMPPTYRGTIHFNNDCEGRSKRDDPAGFVDYQNDFLGTMQTFANTFYPNPVIYQIGYPSLKKLWTGLDTVPKRMGSDIANKCKADQKVLIYWVDFGMKDILPCDNNWQPQPWPKKTSVSRPHPVSAQGSILDPRERYSVLAMTVNGKQVFSLQGSGASILRQLRDSHQSTEANTLLIYRISQCNAPWQTTIVKRLSLQ